MNVTGDVISILHSMLTCLWHGRDLILRFRIQQKIPNKEIPKTTDICENKWSFVVILYSFVCHSNRKMSLRGLKAPPFGDSD